MAAVHVRMRVTVTAIVAIVAGGVVTGLAPFAGAQAGGGAPARPGAASGTLRDSVAAEVPSLGALVSRRQSELAVVVDRYAADQEALFRRYDVDWSPARRARLREFYGVWRERLRALPFDSLSQEGRVDWLLLDNRLRYDLVLLDREEKRWSEMAPRVPFAEQIMRLQEARRRMEPVDPVASAKTLALVAKVADSLRAQLDSAGGGKMAVGAGAGAGKGGAPAGAAARKTGAAKRGAAADATGTSGPAPSDTSRATRIVAYRAANLIASLRETMKSWNTYYTGYDPTFTWWTAEPYRKADSALVSYRKALREKVVGAREGEDDPIIGDPIGADGMKADLAYEMIPYTPEELIAVAEREFAWCEAEMKKAAKEMGFGDDWKKALEKVKTQYVDPGKQPDLVRDLAREAEAFIAAHDLVTVPPLASDIWRMEMMTPQGQKTAPFFLGGEVIQVSFPTDGMTHEEKMMSLRGNNEHFARATVFHELIPGHHLQGFMLDRYNPHRRLFSTPFWIEGWSLWWEMLLWDQGFPRSPEDRVGMLFWRMHRCARIIFSLRFHLGTMSPQQAVDFLVDRVGHERANAMGEVRRSFNGDYSPLYQVAYMMGALQLRALHHDLVDGGTMTNRQFHDAILQGGIMPIEMVRARLTNQPLTRDYTARWKFAGEKPGSP
jgi:hypothetical protein